MQRITAVAFIVWLGCGGSPPPQPVSAQTSAGPTPATTPRIVIADTRVAVLDALRFVGSTPQIADESARTLDALANTLQGNPTIQVVEVQDHAATQDLAEARALAVEVALVARGVAHERLRAAGVLATAGQADEVELVIVQRAP